MEDPILVSPSSLQHLVTINTAALLGPPPPDAQCIVILRLHRKQTLWSCIPSSTLRCPAEVYDKPGATML